MDLFKKNIVGIAEEIISSAGFILVDVIIRGTERNRVIEVFVDGEANVTAEDCAQLSRKMNLVLEEKELIKPPYRLDISSPGVDRPLLYLKQYPKHINRQFEVSYKSGEGEKKLKGKLIKVEEENLTFLTDRELVINFDDIIKAKVLISFS